MNQSHRNMASDNNTHAAAARRKTKQMQTETPDPAKNKSTWTQSRRHNLNESKTSALPPDQHRARLDPGLPTNHRRYNREAMQMAYPSSHHQHHHLHLDDGDLEGEEGGTFQTVYREKGFKLFREEKFDLVASFTFQIPSWWKESRRRRRRIYMLSQKCCSKRIRYLK